MFSRTMKHVAVGVVVFVTTLALIEAPAHATTSNVTGGSLSVPTMIVADSCARVPVDYDFSEMPADWSWSVTLTNSASLGTFIFGAGGVTGTDEEAMWCPADLPGPFALNGTLIVRDADSQVVATDDVTLNYEVRKQQSSMAFVTSDRSPRVGSFVRLRGCVRAEGKREPDREVRLEYRYPGTEFHRITTTYTDSVGCFAERWRAATRHPTFVRATALGTDVADSVVSPEIGMRARLRDTTLAFVTSNRSPRVGSSVLLRGCVRVDRRRDGGREVRLQYRHPGTSFHSITTANTAADGCFAQRWQVTTTRPTFLKATVLGTDEATSRTSQQIGLRTKPKPVAKKPKKPKKSKPRSGCDSNYGPACVPIASDVDCGGGSGNGPEYFYGVTRVIGDDIYDLDRDGDGWACEPS